MTLVAKQIMSTYQRTQMILYLYIHAVQLNFNLILACTILTGFPIFSSNFLKLMCRLHVILCYMQMHRSNMDDLKLVHKQIKHERLTYHIWYTSVTT